MPQMLSSEIRRRELYILGPRHQLMVIERETDYHWLFFGLLMCLLVPNSSWHLPSTKAWHDCGSVFEIEVHKNVLIAEKVTICLIERWRLPQLDETSWRNMEDGWGWSLDGFWMFSGQHPIVASIQILVTQISKLLIAHRGFLASEINNLTRQKSPSHRFHRAVTNALCWLYQIAEPDHRIRKVRWSDLWLGVQVKDCLSEV